MGAGSYAGCAPDLDYLSSAYEGGGAGRPANTAGKGGSAGVGGSVGGTSGDAGSDDPGGMGSGAVGGSQSAGTGGTAGSGGAGGPSTGGSAGTAGSLGGEGGDGAGGSPEGGAGGSPEGGAGGAGGEPAMCEPGFVTCPGGLECGTDLDVGDVSGATASNCGACGVTCSLSHASSSICTDGTCAPACVARYANCNGTANDACEVHLDALDRCASGCTDGIACDATQVCNSGSCGAAQGLVVLTVPMNVANENQRYADRFSPFANLAEQSVHFRLYAPGATGGSFIVFMTDSSDFTFSSQTSFPLAGMSARWVDIEVPVPPSANAYDATSLYQVTFDVVTEAGPWTDPTVIYIDRIWSSNLTVNDTFDTSLGQMVPSSFETIPGATLTWLDAMPP